MKKKGNLKAFSLVELSIIMTVIATIAAGYIYVGSASTNDNSLKIDATYKKMLKIDGAIKNFVTTFNRLPCPAKSTIAFGSSTSSAYNTVTYNFFFDNEYMANTGTSSYGNGAECLSAIGSVPTKTLNLPTDFMLDAWGNKILMHVSPALCGQNSTTPKTCNSSSFINNNANLTVNTVSPSSTVTNAAYVLVSAGPNQYGAYTAAGVYTANSPNSNETNNAANKAYTSTTYNKYLMSSTFDDIVIFATKNQISSSSNLPSNPYLTSAACTNNSNWMNQMSSSNLTDIRTNMTILSTSDAAMLDMMWVLQEVCGELYNTSKQCPLAATYSLNSYSSTLNACTYTY